jgi:hypothetical protein
MIDPMEKEYKQARMEPSCISENGKATNDQIVKEERIGGDQNVKEEKRKSKGKVKALFDVVFEQSGIGLAAALAPRKGGLAPPGDNW